MKLKEAIELVYGLVENGITEDSDSSYLEAQEVIEEFLNTETIIGFGKG